MRKNSVLVFLAAAELALGQSATQNPPDVNGMSIEELLNVRIQTASLEKQSLQDAPASVTVVTSEEIRRYGYRTLAEALSGVRSFYVTSDGPSRYAGVRGFSLLGDYNTRFLVLINGHRLTDNVYGAMYYFGQDFPLDMDLIHQIEIVRGPTSALYGGNGIFATVNIITKTPTNAPRGRVSTELGSFGEQKLIASSSFSAGHGVKVLFSASVGHTAGRTVVFPELAQAGVSPSQTGHAGEESGYRMFADVTWRNWTVSALFGQHKYIVPTGWFGTEVGNTATHDVESRNFVEAAWNRALGQNGSIRWRTYYDQYSYDGAYKYGGSHPNFDGAAGDWAGSELVYQHETGSRGTLTAGGEINVDARNIQYNFDIIDTEAGPVRQDNFRISHPRTSYGFFAQQEFQLSPAWTAYFGGRIDGTSYDAPFFSPRVAFVYKHTNTAYKLIYGRAFRNPSTFERYWEPNPALTSERIETYEVAREQRLNRRVNLITSVFHYKLDGLIIGVPVTETRLQYRNASNANATGVEMELSGQPTDWLETAASFSIERSRIDSSQRMQNSPVRLGQFRASVPLARQRLMLSGAVRYIGSRLDANALSVPAMTPVDVTATARHFRPGLELQLGVRNVLNQAFSDPLSPEHATSRMPDPGRSMFVKLTWRYD